MLPDGSVLSWGGDGTLRVWDLTTREGRVLTSHGSVRGALVLSDGSMLSWGDDGTLRVWDLTTRESRALTGHEDSVGGVLVLSDGRVLSWSRDGTFRIWNLATGEGRVLTSHEDQIYKVLLLPNDCVLWSSADRSVRRRQVTHDGSGTAFYFDGTVTVVLPITDDQFFVGDSLGRIHLLEFVDVSSQINVRRLQS